MSVPKPSLDLLRQLSDENVLAALVLEARLTRAELATRTGISKPTVADSVRRLAQAGVVVDTGERTTARGGVGTYYALAPDVGVALALTIAPEGITAELVDAYGAVVTRSSAPVSRGTSPAAVRASLIAVCRRAQARAPGPTRAAVVSAADPVDRRSGRLVHLPDAPFLLGELSPVDALRDLVAGPVIVDNDVNWAARAERLAFAPGTLDNFVYLYLGEGLGCAVVSDGEIRRGHSGMAGEIAHVVTTGVNGEACPFTTVFEQLGLRYPNSTAIDGHRLTSVVNTDGPKSDDTRRALGRATSGVLSAIVALADPVVVVIGGSWGTNSAVLKSIRAEARKLARVPQLRLAHVITEAPLAGARTHAVAELRRAIANYRGAPDTDRTLS